MHYTDVGIAVTCIIQDYPCPLHFCASLLDIRKKARLSGTCQRRKRTTRNTRTGRRKWDGLTASSIGQMVDLK